MEPCLLSAFSSEPASPLLPSSESLSLSAAALSSFWPWSDLLSVWLSADLPPGLPSCASPVLLSLSPFSVLPLPFLPPLLPFPSWLLDLPASSGVSVVGFFFVAYAEAIRRLVNVKERSESYNPRPWPYRVATLNVLLSLGGLWVLFAMRLSYAHLACLYQSQRPVQMQNHSARASARMSKFQSPLSTLICVEIKRQRFY